MKVKIGPYPSRLTCNIHTNYMQKKYGFKWPDQNRFENFLEKLEDFIQTLYTPFNYFLDKRTQIVNVKIDSWDTWSMDHTLAHIVLPMLVQLKQTKHGAPFVENKDRPQHLRAKPKKHDTDKFHFEAWDWVLDEMIWAFNQKCLDNWEEQYYGEWIKDESKTLGGYHINADDEGRKAHQERMSNGFRLFGKYYEGLWD
jgi:hypothetical protein